MSNPGAVGFGKSDDDRTRRRYAPVVESFESREMMAGTTIANVSVVAKKPPPPPPPPPLKVVSVDGVGIGTDVAKPAITGNGVTSAASIANITAGISLAVYELKD